jgi:lysophospholipase L1-like esterase
MVRKDYLHLNQKGSRELARLLDEALQPHLALQEH